MFNLLLISTLVLSTLAFVAEDLDSKRLFESWKKEHQISYKTKMEDFSRLQVFRRTLKTIQKHNSNPARTWDMGLNQFSAMSWEEFKLRRLMAPQHCSATHSAYKSIQLPKEQAAPNSIDWRQAKVVSEVKDQGNCGSCWSFSTTGVLESHRAIYWGQLVELSEQNLIDCAQKFNNNGCNGGLPSQAMEYVRYNKGLNTEFSYPYVGKTGRCHFKRTAADIGVQVLDVYNITSQDENEIYQAVASRGPVSIAFDVARDFQHYTKGVYQSTECKTDPQHVNHAVLVVGYNQTSTGMPFWIVKNSWSDTWGMNGYFEIVRGKNECGLADCASFPILPPPQKA